MTAETATKFRRPVLSFYPAERLIIGITVFLLVIDVVLVQWRGANVDWLAYKPAIIFSLGLLIVGQYCRHIRAFKSVALAITCIGMFSVYSAAAGLFNYLFLPLRTGLSDDLLIWLDSLMGFHWPDAIELMAAYPAVSLLLKYVYQSLLPQILLLLLLLGLTGKRDHIHAMMLTLVISSLTVISFWVVFPTFGPAAHYTIAPETIEAARLFVDAEYGRELNRIAVYGPEVITPVEIRGLIAFPSFHIVMGLTCAVFARPFKYLFPFFLAVNILMFPATVGHGGHHVVDLFGGVAVFAIAYELARRVVARRREATEPVTA